MKKNLFRIVICTLVLFFGVQMQSFYVNAEQEVPDMPAPSKEFYVYDENNLLSQTTRDYIMSTNKDLYKKTGAQIVVALVDSLNGYDIETYALLMFRNFKIGTAEKNNGILLLSSIKDGKVRIEVGYGLEGALPDGKAGRILDTYLVPKFKEKQYEQGVMEAYKAIISVVQQEYDVEIDSTISAQDYKTTDNSSRKSLIPIILIVIVIIIDGIFNKGRLLRAIVTMIILSNRNNRGGFGGGGGSSGGSFGGGGSSGGGGASRGF